MRTRLRASAVLLALALAAQGTMATGASARKAKGTCRDKSQAVYQTEDRIGPSGVYALPRKNPRDLVIFTHGYRKAASEYWRGHLRRTANRGALAVAMDYTGIGPAPDYRGWNVRAGAKDSIRAAKHFLRKCRRIRNVVLMGVSMGGNTSGLALAAGATRSDGSPLFDWWIDVEGATNVTETYLAARAAAPADPYVEGARDDIEAEMGGTLEEVPERYREASIVTRAGDIAAAGLRGAILVHGLEDGLVPYDQSREMAAALAGVGIPYEFFTVLTRGEGDDGTTLTGHAGGRLSPDYTSPFAGHGGEEDIEHLVIATAFDRLWALLDGDAPTATRELVTDGIAGTHQLTP